MPWGNLVSAVVRLEHGRTPADLKRVVDALVDWLPGPGQQEIKRSFREWIRLLLAQKGFDVSDLPSRPQLEEVQTMLADQVNDWFDEAEERGFIRGMARAMAQGRGPEVERRIRQDIERSIEQDAPRYGRCCAGRRRGSSMPKRPNSLRRRWTASCAHVSSPRSVTLSSNPIPVPTCSTGPRVSLRLPPERCRSSRR